MNKVSYYSRDNRCKTIAAPTGDGYEKEYSIKLDKIGHKEITCTGKTNADAMIQTYAEECKLENILQRSILDPSVLAAKAAMYDDFTDAPKSLYEAQNVMIEMENLWLKLKPEQREEFNGELSQFIASFKTDKWLKVMGLFEEKPSVTTETKTPEKKGDEE